MKNILYAVLIVASISCEGLTEKKMSVETQVVETAIVQIDEGYDPQAVLDTLGIVLKEPGIPVASYVHAVRTGDLLFLAGKGPKKDDGENVVGKLGADLTLEEGYEAARWAAINQLAVLKAELGNLNRIKRIVKVKGMVNAVPEFTDHSKVINGYSDLMVQVFGDRGKHARAAVGMGSLPGNMAVEVEMVVEVVD
ncbi:RidA family protein [Aggregatimonas sangjinii]|uniref:RidA family protein n=1 Tax=Aggregatimonas sangjinii TaxID=2583587 RepID=A0A5B7SS61_9FLAO|nr:RidA family protein [Aggregatimonas sangjinii]QCX01516.1 RidA family protein [Aggregatimonas sangjinii]